MQNPYGIVSIIPHFVILRSFPAVEGKGTVSSINWRKIINAKDRRRGYRVTAVHTVNGGFTISIWRNFSPLEVPFAVPGVMEYAKHHPVVGPVFRDSVCVSMKEHVNNKKKVKVSYLCTVDESFLYYKLRQQYKFYEEFARANKYKK